MQRRTSPFGYLAIVAAVTTAATVFLTVIGRIPYWLPILGPTAFATLSGAAILFIATDDCKERCIATAAISARTARVARFRSVGGALTGGVADCDVAAIPPCYIKSRIWYSVPSVV